MERMHFLNCQCIFTVQLPGFLNFLQLSLQVCSVLVLSLQTLLLSLEVVFDFLQLLLEPRPPMALYKYGIALYSLIVT